MAARVVITGLGAVSPLGLTAADMWTGLCAGKCGIGPITAFDPVGFDCKIAGQVPDYKIQQHVPKSIRKSTKLMSRDIELAVIAANEAVQSAGLITKAIDAEKVNVDPTRMAINLGAGLISCELAEIAPAVVHSVTDGKFDMRKYGREGLQLVTPLWLLKYLPNMLACHIGIIHDIQGPSNTITCAEASAGLAIGEAAQTIERGHADVSLAGGAEAKVNPIVMMRQNLLYRVTTSHNERPTAACRPFDADASGSVFGEGAGVLVLENVDNARRRGAKILAEVAGIGQSTSISDTCERLEASGRGVEVAVRKALEDAELQPREIDLIIPHGLAVPEDDLAESRGIEAAIGAAVRDVPVWPTKSMLSTTGAASGALDVIAATCVIRDGKIPAARNFAGNFTGCNLNINRQELSKQISAVLCVSFSCGGQVAAIVLKRFKG